VIHTLAIFYKYFFVFSIFVTFRYHLKTLYKIALALTLKALKTLNNLQVNFHVLRKITEVPYKTLLYLFIRDIAAGEFAFVDTAGLFRNFAD